jgi:hypothetical protein
MRLGFISVVTCLATFLLTGCAEQGGNPFGSFGGGGSVARPKTIIVTDFVFASEVVPIDRGYTARLERKIGSFPTFERKQRTAERVNDEIVASIVASLRDAGLDAQPGTEDSITQKDDTVVFSGKLHGTPEVAAIKPDPRDPSKGQVGFGNGRGGVIFADMTVSHFAFGGKKQLTAFSADTGSGGAGNAKQAAAQNAAIASALTAEKAAPEKLSPDVEAQSRKLGRAIGAKFVAYAKEQGWLEKPEGEAAPDAIVKLPEPKPEKKTAAKKPAKPAENKPAENKPAEPAPDADAPDKPDKQ